MLITTIISKALYKSLVISGYFVEKKFIKETKKPTIYNNNLLFNILSNNSTTEIGEKYKFSNIKSLDDFKKAIPLTDYSFYDSYINKMAKGEKNVLVKESVEYFGHTSGTTGKQKLIPVTRSQRLAASKYMALLVPKYSYNNFKNNWSYGKGLIIADIVTTTHTEGGLPICSATSGGFRAIKNIIPFMYTSPVEVMLIDNRETALYLHLLFALKEKNLMYMSGVFISNILDALRTLEKNYPSLIKDIKKGTINKNLDLDNGIRTSLNKLLSPDAGRADELEKEFNLGIKGICKRIWPKFSYIASVTGANFSIYDDKVDFYTDNSPIYSTAYAATEAMIAINPNAKKISYVIIPDTVFYEFINITDSDKNNPSTLPLTELEIGNKYEIVITNSSGLYRYRMGDIIKVIGYYNNCPEIEFQYRKNQLLNMASEKTTEDHLTTSIKNTMKSLHLTLIDYTTACDNTVTPGRYHFYFEFKEDLSSALIKKLETSLDLELQKANLAYGRFRKSNKLAKPLVSLVAPYTFSVIKDTLNTKGVSKSQIKIPRVITTNENILKIITNRIIYNA